MPVTAALVAFLVLAGPSFAAQPTARFGEHASVLAVEIPVQVTRDGEPVRGLEARNFAVFDGRKPLELTSFEMVDLGPGGGSDEVALRRHVVFLFDLGADPGWIGRAREAAIEAVHGAFHPSDLLAVATYKPASGSRLVLGFTSDRRQVELALAGIGVREPPVRWSPDPLGLIVVNGTPGRRARGAMAKEAMQEMVVDADRNTRRDQANGLVGATASLAEFAARLAPVRGRKIVILLSPGYDDATLVGTDADRATRSAIEHGEIWNVDLEQQFGSSAGQNALEAMLETFRRADCVVESIDIAGLRSTVDVDAPRPRGASFLNAIAADTGGRAHLDTNDLGTAIGDALHRSEVTYVLSVQPDVPADGKYHRLRVELRDAGRGAEASFRGGYFAPLPYASQTPATRRLTTADLVTGGRAGGALDLEALAVPLDFPGAAGFVPIVIEISGSDLVAGGAGKPLELEIYAYAFAAGEVRDYLAQPVSVDAAAAGATLAQAGLKFFGHLDLPPGSYSLRVLVRNSGNGAYGLRELALSVPAPQQPGTELSPPLLADTAAWTLARESANESAAPYPFSSMGQAFIPAARARLAAGGRGRFAIYALNPPHGGTLAAIVWDSDGREAVAPMPVAVAQKGPAEALGRETWLFDFAPHGLAPGRYRLALRYTPDDGASVESPSVTLEVR